MQGKNFQTKLGSISQKIQDNWRYFNQWLIKTPERSLMSAYQSACVIRNIELEQFGGKKIAPDSANLPQTVISFWQDALRRNLFIIQIRLAEFNLSSNLRKVTNPELLDQLRLIDEVIARYEFPDEFPMNTRRELITQPSQNNYNFGKKQSTSSEIVTSAIPGKSQTQKTVNIPNLTQNFSVKSEKEFVRNYRISRNRTQRAVRFLIILIFVPLLVQFLSQRLILNPVVEKIRGDSHTGIFINSDMKKEAFKELNIYQESLRFDFLHRDKEIDQEEIATKVKSRAMEIAEEFRSKSSNAVSNIFADLISLFTFAAIIFLGKKDIFFLKSLMDEIVYGLSDSAKAFVIILSTDIFVGFHSPHGWEVLLDGLAEHLGLPANESVIFAFIATFPVILATIFKYWIFRYLSRLSPSALATLREMDD
jgi:hypothetical protein